MNVLYSRILSYEYENIPSHQMESEADSTTTVQKMVQKYSGYVIPVLIAIVVIGILVYYFYPSNKTTVFGPFALVASSPVQLSPRLLVPQAQLPKGLDENYTVSFYVYMNDLTSPSFAPSDDMRYHKVVELTGACSIFMDPVQQSAQIVLNPATPSGAGLPNTTLTVSNFLTSRWNQLAFTVEGRTIDCYLNGALVTSTLLPDVPRSVPTQITLYPMAGFTGQLGYVQLWPRRLTLPEMTANYKQTSDLRGKPYIPTPGTSLNDLLAIFSRGFCSLGLCVDPDNTNPLRSIDYLYA
jgi:hypothetical protein